MIPEWEGVLVGQNQHVRSLLHASLGGLRLKTTDKCEAGGVREGGYAS